MEQNTKWSTMLQQVADYEAAMIAAGKELATEMEEELQVVGNSAQIIYPLPLQPKAATSAWGESDPVLDSMRGVPSTEEWIKSEEVHEPPMRLKGVDALRGRVPEKALVPGYILKRGILQNAGAPYGGKTAFMINLACSVAAGLPDWMGLPTTMEGPGDVIYVALEGGQPFEDAVQAWAVSHPDADLSGFRYLDGDEGNSVRIKVNKRDEEVEWAESLMRLQDEIHREGLKPRMIVFDTQVDLAPGIEENSAGDISMLFTELKDLANKYQCVVAVLHHLNKNGDYRGSTAQFGKADMAVKLTVEDDLETRSMEFIKVKGAPRPKENMIFHIVGQSIPDGSGMGPLVMPGPPSTAEQISSDQKQVYEACLEGASLSKVRKATGFGRDKAMRLLSEMVEDGLLSQSETNGTKYYEAVPIC